MNNSTSKQEYSPEQFIQFLTGAVTMPERGIVTGDVSLNDAELDCNRISGWRFDGKLDLSECRFKGGFRFEDNSFGGKVGAGLALRRARINGQLIIKNCINSKIAITDIDITTKDTMSPMQFSSVKDAKSLMPFSVEDDYYIDLREIVVENGLEISGCSLTTNAKSACFIVLHSAFLGGPSMVKLEDYGYSKFIISYLLAANLHVRGELRVESCNHDWVWLRNGNFDKDLIIKVKQFAFVGGRIIISDSQVGGDLKITSSDSQKDPNGRLEKLDFRSVRVSGDILVKCDEKDDEMRIKSINGANSVVSGNIALKGIAVGFDTIAVGFDTEATSNTLICLAGATSGRSIILSDITYMVSPEDDCKYIVDCNDCAVSERLIAYDIKCSVEPEDSPFSGVVVDFSGAKARTIFVAKVNAPTAAIDLRAVTVSQLIEVSNASVSRLNLQLGSATELVLEDNKFSSTDSNAENESFNGAALDIKINMQVANCCFGKFNLPLARIGKDLKLSAATFTQLDLSHSIIGGLLDFDGDEKERKKRGRTMEQKALVDEALEWVEINTKDRIDKMKRLKCASIITSGDQIVVDYLQAREIDFRGCFFIPKDIKDEPSTDIGEPPKTSPYVSGIGMKILRSVRLRSSQFVGEHAIPAKDKLQSSQIAGNDAISAKDRNRVAANKEAEAAKMLVDFSGANIGELDLARPLPSPIRLIGAVVREWRLKDQNADNYAEVLKCTGNDKLDIPHYLRVEEMFENSGNRKEADGIHRKWRERERSIFWKNKQYSIWLGSWLHSKTLGYGTERWRMVVIIFILWAVSAGLFWCNHDHWLQPDTTLQSSLVQCGAGCENRRIPEPFTVSDRQQATNAMAFALRQNVPLVDLALVPPYEANPDTWAPFFITLFRILGWLTWPVLLASVVSGLFPKRYQA